VPPTSISITATSAEDPAQSGAGTVTLSSGPFIQTLQPSSILTSNTGTLTLRVQGTNLAAGAVVLIDGVARATNCVAGTQCTLQLIGADFNTAGDRGVQVEVPGSPAVRSNQVIFRVVAASASDDVIALTNASPVASNRDVVVVESFGASAGTGAANLAAIGQLVQSACDARGFYTSITRPAAGSQSFDICLTGEGISNAQGVTISGPAPNDVVLSNLRNFGLTLVFTVTISSTTVPGPRTVFVETTTRDKAAATGAIEVK
jgi:hypothetical protein